MKATVHPLKMRCENCGSEEVTRDGTLAWSVDEQRWEAAGAFDTFGCNSCGTEAKQVEEVKLEGDELKEYEEQFVG